MHKAGWRGGGLVILGDSSERAFFAAILRGINSWKVDIFRQCELQSAERLIYAPKTLSYGKFTFQKSAEAKLINPEIAPPPRPVYVWFVVSITALLSMIQWTLPRNFNIRSV